MASSSASALLFSIGARMGFRFAREGGYWRWRNEEGASWQLRAEGDAAEEDQEDQDQDQTPDQTPPQQRRKTADAPPPESVHSMHAGIAALAEIERRSGAEPPGLATKIAEYLGANIVDPERDVSRDWSFVESWLRLPKAKTRADPLEWLVQVRERLKERGNPRSIVGSVVAQGTFFVPKGADAQQAKNRKTIVPLPHTLRAGPFQYGAYFVDGGWIFLLREYPEADAEDVLATTWWPQMANDEATVATNETTIEEEAASLPPDAENLGVELLFPPVASSC